MKTPSLLGRAFNAVLGRPSQYDGGGLVPSSGHGIDAGNPTGRRLAAIPSNASAINSLISTYGKTVIARSRYLCTNNPYAVSAKEQWISSLVGSGIKPSSLVGNPDQKKALMEAWRDWTDEADFDGRTDFYGVQALIAAELFEAGEVFVRIRRAPKNMTVPIKLQLLPSEMLPYTDFPIAVARGNRVELGIEFDANDQRVAYHFHESHPGEMRSYVKAVTGRLVRVPANEVLHLYRPLRAGQLRGIPQSISAMSRLAMLDLYDDAELERKRTTALFAAFVTKPPSEDEDDHPLGVADVGSLGTTIHGAGDFAMESGAIIDLNPGEEINFSQPADVGSSYDPFQYRMLLQIAAGFGVPYSNMTGDMSKANYGSIRAGELTHRRRVEAVQHNVMIFQFGRPIWELFLRFAVLGGLTSWTISQFMTDRSLRRCKWIPPKWNWIDPLKDRQAEKVAVDNGFKSRDDVIEEEGYDPEEMDARIAASQARLKDMGIELGDPTKPPPAPPAPAAAPGEEPEPAEGDPPEENEDEPAEAPADEGEDA